MAGGKGGAGGTTAAGGAGGVGFTAPANAGGNSVLGFFQWGDGGVGVQFTTTTGAIFTNAGTVTGGNGGAGGADGVGKFTQGTAGTPGAGGVGIVGGGLTIIDSGTISGGLGGDGATRADAIDFTGGGFNTLTLEPGYNIVGKVVASGAVNILELGGTGTATFDVSLIGLQYQGFEVFFKTGSSTWTLTNTTTAVTSWDIEGGILAISNDGSLGDPSGTVGLFFGGTLQFLAALTSNRTIILNSGGGTFDTDGNNVTLGGVITGNNLLTKVGAGTLTLSGASTYHGGTALDGGTLDVAALGAAGAGAITFALGTETLAIENAALSNHSFGNTIVNFGFGDLVDLTGLVFVQGATASYDPTTHVLSVTSNGVTDKLTLTSPAGTVFKLVSDGNVGTEIELVPTPTITGTQANQQPSSFQPLHPFGQVVIGDGNPGQTETVTITRVENTGNAITNALFFGVLSDPRAATDHSHNVNGVYTVSGTPSAVTTALQGLLFSAGLDETHYTIHVTDTVGQTATDHTTSILGILG